MFATLKRSRSWFWILLAALILLGIARLRFDTEILNLLPRLPVAEGLKTYQRYFSNTRELIITLDGSDADETEAAARELAHLLRSRTNLVAEVAWQPGWMESPAQASELVAALWLNQPAPILAELTNRLSPTNLDTLLSQSRQRLATSLSPGEIALGGYDPFGLTRLPASVSNAAPSMDEGEEFFASQDGTFRLMFVEAKPDITGYRPCRAWLGAIQQLVGQHQQAGELGNVQLSFTGRPAFVTEIAGGMENDMAGSAGGTLAIIGVLFWLTHRRVRPLLWLLFLLVLILAATTAVGGLFFGTINVVSMGFASILLGLAEDFGIVVYQETRSHPELDEQQIRREVAPGIFWSAVTTAGAFLILNLSILPGLGQLGSLVAIGITLAAVIMLYGFLPPLLKIRRQSDVKVGTGETRERFLLFAAKKLLPAWWIWWVTAILLFGSILILWQTSPRLDHSPNVLKPKNSQANATLEKIKQRFGRTVEPLWVLTPGKDENEVGERLRLVNETLARAASNGLINGFTLPTSLWPQPRNQTANRTALEQLVSERDTLHQAALKAGFTEESLLITDSILDHWNRALQVTDVFWPSSPASHWILGKIMARTESGILALGLVHPTADAARTRQLAAEWPHDLEKSGVLLSGWELLGSTVFDTVIQELPRVMIPILALVLISLWLAFRSFKEVLMSLVTLLFTGALLAAAMVVLHWDWNILNLMAVPLLLGMGVDFSIHVQLALRRYQGDRLAVRRSVGRALLLAGATTVAGFACLAFSTNAGMSSLGKVCALGITLAMVTAVYLLPVWWIALTGIKPPPSGSHSVGQ